MEHEQKVIISDIRMPFFSMVVFMVKWALASIPALFILFTLGALLSLAMSYFFGGQHIRMY